jgi:hypothetical protein
MFTHHCSSIGGVKKRIGTQSATVSTCSICPLQTGLILARTTFESLVQGSWVMGTGTGMCRTRTGILSTVYAAAALLTVGGHPYQ